MNVFDRERDGEGASPRPCVVSRSCCHRSCFTRSLSDGHTRGASTFMPEILFMDSDFVWRVSPLRLTMGISDSCARVGSVGI